MNGRVNARNQMLNSTAKYECNDGFVLTGDDRVRKCLTGGSWSGKPPLCECKFIITRECRTLWGEREQAMHCGTELLSS